MLGKSVVDSYLKVKERDVIRKIELTVEKFKEKIRFGKFRYEIDPHNKAMEDILEKALPRDIQAEVWGWGFETHVTLAGKIPQDVMMYSDLMMLGSLIEAGEDPRMSEGCYYRLKKFDFREVEIILPDVESPETLKTPKDLIDEGTGDCDDYSLFLACALLYQSISAEILLVPRHALCVAYTPRRIYVGSTEYFEKDLDLKSIQDYINKRYNPEETAEIRVTPREIIVLRTEKLSPTALEKSIIKQRKERARKGLEWLRKYESETYKKYYSDVNVDKLEEAYQKFYWKIWHKVEPFVKKSYKSYLEKMKKCLANKYYQGVAYEYLFS